MAIRRSRKAMRTMGYLGLIENPAAQTQDSQMGANGGRWTRECVWTSPWIFPARLSKVPSGFPCWTTPTAAARSRPLKSCIGWWNLPVMLSLRATRSPGFLSCAGVALLLTGEREVALPGAIPSRPSRCCLG
eukprot:CAMPEP_0114229112 /NCGR_PEP_ID=MMETSP0058-20121206/2722_1 /TAXON_ID=36894 /ORGANISM="Pyramimonas parkeae, CCMP726" /LENGTH=131 /DNA_ID=CAMNT_0001340143 /DNA_START=386 /DNA_END=777 /DNA_ORIENTATION=-